MLVRNCKFYLYLRTFFFFFDVVEEKDWEWGGRDRRKLKNIPNIPGKRNKQTKVVKEILRNSGWGIHWVEKSGEGYNASNYLYLSIIIIFSMRNIDHS